MSESFWIRDAVVLGQGAPNSIRKIGGRQGRCICLWSKDLGYCRVYPVPFGYVHDWEIIDAEVRRPSNDGRENSFVIFNYEKEFGNLSKRIYVHKVKSKYGNVKTRSLGRDEQLAFSRHLAKDTFSQIRGNKSSFGLIKPVNCRIILEKNKERSEAQKTLNNFGVTDLDSLIMNQNDYAWLPFLEYSCEETCKSRHPHRQKIVEWGAYLWMKQKPNSYEHCIKLVDNYHMNEQGYERYILIGNIRQYPTTYIVVKIVRFKKQQ
ncbi:hypothetical protein HYU15_01310 [Candidatus Woesearchaeota archaeon]|nr:hypothetical protein [Candidatus Woesearchaeota archaeon]